MGISLTLEKAWSITELPCACQQHRGKIKLGTRKKTHQAIQEKLWATKAETDKVKQKAPGIQDENVNHSFITD